MSHAALGYKEQSRSRGHVYLVTLVLSILGLKKRASEGTDLV